MARHKTNVRALASEAGRDPEDVLVHLLDLGLTLQSGSDRVPKGRLSTVRAALALPASPPTARRSDVAALAAKAGLSEAEARNRLTTAGVLSKKRLKKVPNLLHS